jgi:transposase
MRFVGIDVAAERHVVAVVNEGERVICRPTAFGEDAAGYEELFRLLGAPEECLVALEATGHYWPNLFLAMTTRGYAVAVLNPLRSGDLRRRNSNERRPMQSTRSGSRALQRKSGPHPLNSQTRSQKSYASW